MLSQFLSGTRQSSSNGARGNTGRRSWQSRQAGEAMRFLVYGESGTKLIEGECIGALFNSELRPIGNVFLGETGIAISGDEYVTYGEAQQHMANPRLICVETEGEG